MRTFGFTDARPIFSSGFDYKRGTLYSVVHDIRSCERLSISDAKLLYNDYGFRVYSYKCRCFIRDYGLSESFKYFLNSGVRESVNDFNKPLGHKNHPLTLSLDCEWVSFYDPDVGCRNHTLSHQLSFIIGDLLFDFVFVYENSRVRRLTLESFISHCLDGLRKFLPFSLVRKSCLRDNGVKNFFVNIVFHFGLGDLLAFDTSRGYDHLSRLSSSGKSVFSTSFDKPCTLYVSNRNYAYKAQFTFRDSFAHTTGEKSLSALGDSIKYPKVSLPDGAIERMDKLLVRDPDLFYRYAISDSRITLLYLSVLYGCNKSIPVTLSGHAVSDYINFMIGKHIDSMRLYLDDKGFSYHNKLSDRAVFSIFYSGFLPADDLSIDNDLTDFMRNSMLKPVNDTAHQITTLFSNSYFGGRNQCYNVGFYDTQTYDHDIKFAYPSSACLVKPIDFLSEPDIFRGKKKLTLDDCPDPTVPVYFKVAFRFPDNVPCSIAQKVGGSLVFTRESTDFPCESGAVDALTPEVYAALKLGAEVICFLQVKPKLTDVFKTDHCLHPIADHYSLLTSLRLKAVNEYGKGSLQEQFQKAKSVSLYGKHGQGVTHSKSFYAGTKTMEPTPVSGATSSYMASMSTSLPRGFLALVQAVILECGYQYFSETTDGFITDMPLQELERCCAESPLTKLYYQKYIDAVRFLSGDNNSGVFTCKHKQKTLLNLTTRGNTTLEVGGVHARNGYNSGFPKGSTEDRERFYNDTLTRSGNVPFTVRSLPNLKDVVFGVKEFVGVDTVVHIDADFDCKRMPLKPSIAFAPYKKGFCEVANFKTEPHKTADSFLRLKNAKEILKKDGCLKTFEDIYNLLTVYDCLESGFTEKRPSTRIYSNKDLERKIVFSLVRYSKNGDYPELSWIDNLTARGVVKFFNDSGLLKQNIDVNLVYQARRKTSQPPLKMSYCFNMANKINQIDYKSVLGGNVKPYLKTTWK